MAPKSDNVQRLLQAEEKRNRIVAEAKARKIAKVKQAKADAEETVADFRAEKESEFQSFKSQQMGYASADNGKYVASTDQQISELKRLSKERQDKVANLVVSMVCAQE